MTDSPPARWYPDPQNDGALRYWDGTQWTDHTAPAPDPNELLFEAPHRYMGGHPSYPVTGMVPVDVQFRRGRVTVTPRGNRNPLPVPFEMLVGDIARVLIDELSPDHARGWTLSTGVIGSGSRIAATSTVSIHLRSSYVVLLRADAATPVVAARLAPFIAGLP